MNSDIQPSQGQQYGGTSSGRVPPSSHHMYLLMTTAAVAVIIASLAAVTAITGILPTSKVARGSTDPNVAAQSATVVLGVSTSVTLAAPDRTMQPAQAAPHPAQNVVPAPVCAREPSYAERTPPGNPGYAQTQLHQSASPYVGHVTSVTLITMQGKKAGLGIVGGVVVGGLLGNQIGRGNGCTFAAAGGALAGGYDGYVAENYYHHDTEYRVNIHMNDDTTYGFMCRAAPDLQADERVCIENGTLAAG